MQDNMPILFFKNFCVKILHQPMLLRHLSGYISRYGTGMKYALFKLGRHFTLTSMSIKPESLPFTSEWVRYSPSFSRAVFLMDFTISLCMCVCVCVQRSTLSRLKETRYMRAFRVHLIPWVDKRVGIIQLSV